MSKEYRVISRQPEVGDTVLIMDELVRVTGLEFGLFNQVDQVLVERDGEAYSISPFETPIEVVEFS